MLSLHALLVSTGTIALAEIGDKTQLLALLLTLLLAKLHTHPQTHEQVISNSQSNTHEHHRQTPGSSPSL
jgi:hypothetical protein